MNVRTLDLVAQSEKSVSRGRRLNFRGHIDLLRLACGFFFCVVTAQAVIAQDLMIQESSPVTRADPVSFWEAAGNPAAQAFSGDAFSVAIRKNFNLNSPNDQTDDPMQNLDMGFGLGGLFYNSLYGLEGRTNLLSSTLGMGSLGAGISIRWTEGEKWTGPDSRYDFGILYRPYNLVSFGLTMEDFSSSSPTWGAGLAIRPLVAWPQLEYTLTLAADATLRDGTALLQSVSARFMLDSWLGLKAWVQPESLRIGLQTHLRLGLGESELVLHDIDARDTGTFASALRFNLPNRRSPLPYGKHLLVIDELEFLPTTPSAHYLPGFKDKIWLGSLIAAIDRAAEDRQVAGIVIYQPPLTASIADAQALYRSLAAFKATGKPLFVYAKVLGRSDYIHTAVLADYLALDPNGHLGLVDLGSFDLYFRGFFEKLGIRMYNLQSHDTKTAYNNFSEYDITEAERAMKERYVGGLANQAYTLLDKARGEILTKPAADLIRSGPYLIPAQAKDAGLIDAEAYRDEFDITIEERLGRVSRLDIQDYCATTGNSWGPAVGTKTVAVLYLQGNIINTQGVAARSIGQDTALTLAALRDDPRVDGILLRVDSGGGSAMMSDLIAREVRLTVEAGKSVYVSMGGYAASGGYYISAPASRIYAEEGTITGSIGVTGLRPDASGLLNKLAIGSASVDAGDNANFGNMLLPRREDDADVLADYIRHIYERFIAVVAQGRSMDRSRVDELGQGQVWLGSEAVVNGLIDEIGGLQAAKAGMRKEFGRPVQFVDLLPGQAPVGFMVNRGNSNSLFKSVIGSPRIIVPGTEVLTFLDKNQAGVKGPAMPLVIKQTLELAAELEELGSGPQTLFTEYLFRDRVRH